MNSFIENVNYVAGLDNRYGSGIELYKNNLSLKSVQHDIELKFSYYNNDDKKIHSIVHSEPGVLVGGIEDTLLSFKTLVESSITGSEFTCTVNFVINSISIVNISIVSNNDMYKAYELEMKVVTAGAVTYDVFGEVKDSLKILPSLAMITTSDIDAIVSVYEIQEDVITVSENIANVETVSDSIANVNTVGISISNVNIVGEDIANVNTVSTHISNVDTVSQSITNVNTVSSNIVDVGIASANILNINTVANAKNLADIIRVADDLNSLDVNGIADITIVANDLVLGIDSNIITVSESIDNVNIAGNDIDNINTVVADIVNVDIVSTNINDINITANNIASVNNVSLNIAEVNTVSDGIINVNTVSGSIANVNTVASNIVGLNSIVSNMPEILLANDNAAIATTKALESSDSAAASLQSALDSAASAASALSALSSATTATTNANTSATQSATSAGQSATSASSAASSATDANTSKLAAASSADAASASAVNANQSALDAIEALDEFTDIYLGRKVTAPTVDNDGNALVEGTIYWNTTSKSLFIHDGTDWNTAVFDASGAVTSFNGRDGAVTLTNSDVTGATGQDLSVVGTPSFASVKVTGGTGLTAGVMSWNADESTVDLVLENGVTLQLGQENNRLVRANSSVTNGRLCMFAGTIGNSGRVKVKHFTGLFSEHSLVYGIATQDITSGSDGYITTNGKVREIDTTGAPYGEVWADEDVIYAKPNDNGALTNVEPGDDKLKMIVATVIHAHSNGTLEIRVLPFNENMIAKRANKLTTARAISLSGDASGSVDFDGSANANITVTVADDSHLHSFGNLTGKPDTIAGYGITNAYTKTEIDLVVGDINSALDTINGEVI